MLSALLAFGTWAVAAGHELAVVRPFASTDEVRHLADSFQSWNTFQPCSEAGTRTSVDLYLVYSRAFQSNSDAALATKQISESFRRQDEAWHKCFRHLHLLSADLSQEEDVYDAKHQDENPNWVNGPNAVFRFILSRFLDSGYHAFFLMELDSIPKKSLWLDQLEREVLDYPPAVIRGSRYRGDRWNKFLSNLPESLRVHINGNAIYYTSHPMLSWLNDRLQMEASTPRKAIPYDVRMAQLLVAGRRKTNAACSEAWDTFVPYGSHEPYASDSNLIGNYANTLLNSSFNSGEYITHGSAENIFDEVDPSKVTLGVEYLDDESFQKFEHSIENQHPFRKIIVLKRDAAVRHDTEWHTTPGGISEVRWKAAKRPQSKVLCEMAQHVGTEFFVYTDSGRRLRGNVSMLVDGNRPLLPYVAADSVLCHPRRSCRDSIAKASQLFGVSLQEHFDLPDILFRTSSVHAFCAAWEGVRGVRGRAFTGDDYVAWLSGTGSGLYSQYVLVDRGEKGWRPWTLEQPSGRVVVDEARELQRELQGVGSNDTNGTCENFTTQQECTGDSQCTWTTNGDCLPASTETQDETILNLMTLIVDAPATKVLTNGMNTSSVDAFLASLKSALDPAVKSIGGDVIRGVEFTLKVNYRAQLDFDSEPADPDKCATRTAIIRVVCRGSPACRITVTAANMPTCSGGRLLEDIEDALPPSFRGAWTSRELTSGAYAFTYDAEVNITDGADIATVTNPADPNFETSVQSELTSSNVSGFAGAPQPVTTSQTLVRVLTVEGSGVDYAQIQSDISGNVSVVETAFAVVLGVDASNLSTTPDLCLGRTCNGQGPCVDGVCQCNPGWLQPNCIVEVNFTTTTTTTTLSTSTMTGTNTTTSTITTTPPVFVTNVTEDSEDETAVAVIIACSVITGIALLLCLLYYFLKPEPAAAAAAAGEDPGKTFI